MFSLPIGTNVDEIEKPIPVPEVSVAEFEALLRFFYDGYVHMISSMDSQGLLKSVIM